MAGLSYRKLRCRGDTTQSAFSAGIRFHCSSSTLFANWLAGFSFSTDQRPLAVSSAVGKGMDRAMEICMLRDEFLTMRTLRLTGSMELLRALQFVSYRRASVAHDHVYGIRSLLPIEEQGSLQPDYSLSYASFMLLLPIFCCEDSKKWHCYLLL